ncbi:MAG: aldose 1-epimerase [Chloroflexota bacterium]|nr:aldose 1-epimerase [Chloroflexota bacterium]
MESVTIAHENIEVVVLPEFGARLHRLRAFGHDLLRTPSHVDAHRGDPFFWGAYNMAPWCNRVSADPTRVGRRTLRLATNFGDGAAIHGQVYARPWQQTGERQFAVAAGGDDWPWPYEVTLTVHVDGGLVVISQAMRNLADEPMPAGLGLHPWFRRAALIAIHGDSVYETNTNSPAEPRAVIGQFDLRELGRMATGLDATWSDVARPAVELRWPEIDLRATIASDSPTLHITAASPRDIDGLAVEPQTHAPQGLRRLIGGEPGALAWLEPGQVLGQRIEIDIDIDKGASG